MSTKRVEIKVGKDKQLELFSHSGRALLLNYTRTQVCKADKQIHIKINIIVSHVKSLYVYCINIINFYTNKGIYLYKYML